MADLPLLKDFVDTDAVTQIGAAIAEVHPGFDVVSFVAAVFDDEWEARALKQRIRHVAMTARVDLGGEYREALAVMRAAAERLTVGGIPVWCFNDFVEEYGVDDPDVSLPALEQFTKLASAEFAVRPFINLYPDRMAVQMCEWAQSRNAHVRRLASEGYRPRLPWGMGIPVVKKDPAPVLAVLELLRSDSSETVRRSVANNLNDISKDHPELAVSVLEGWGADTPEALKLRKHALRTLLKRGHPAALRALGFSPEAAVEVGALSILPERGLVGSHVVMEFDVAASGPGPQSLMIDYAVVYQNVSGTGSRKVFKGVVVDLAAGEVVTLKRKISLKQMSTRRIVPGPHRVEAQVNGVVHAVAAFDVVE
jgi:3-methyladenine DNA glycosylase AlkC